MVEPRRAEGRPSLSRRFRDQAGQEPRHVEPDWLLIWYEAEEELVLAATGTHSDLFG
ncbi:MAG: type II toxin-antitoxin system YafQ family toxin [Alphaproteobacteria bacterium]|nr:type II toxin-antitoxin system YafQ family toxin [Alphaproteobacteria bacterium]